MTDKMTEKNDKGQDSFLENSWTFLHSPVEGIYYIKRKERAPKAQFQSLRAILKMQPAVSIVWFSFICNVQ